MTRALLIAVIAILGVYALFFVFHAVQVISYPLDVDNEEGFILAQAASWADNVSPYRSVGSPPYLVANYPPIYPWILSLPIRFGSLSFAWGRSLSTLAILGVACLIYGILWDRTRSMYWSMVGALLFLSFKQVYSWGPLHRVDSLGLLFSVSGLYLLERRWKAIWPSLLWVLAIFTRQTLLAAPLAGFILFHRFLGKKEKKAFLYWFVSPVAGLYILLAILTRGEFLRHTVLYNMNDYRWENAWPYQHQLWRNTGVFVAPALAYMIHTHLRGRHDWLPSFLLLGWLSSLLAGKVGSGENYILEFVTGVSLAVPLLCREVTAALKQENRSMTAFCPALLLIGALGNFHVSAYPELPGRLSFFNRRGYDYAWTPQPVDVGEAAIFRQWSEKNITGRVFSQFAGWTLLTRHQVEYQPFILNQLAKEKRWDYGKLTEPIRQQAFSAIVIEHGEIPDPNRVGPGTDTFPSEFFVSMFGRYTLVPHPGGFGPGNAWGNVYVPAPPPVP